MLCAENSLFICGNESGTWLLLGLGAEGGPQQDELLGLALAAQRPQVQPAGSGHVHSLHTTLWHLVPPGTMDQCPGHLSASSPLAISSFSAAWPHFNWN